LPRSSRRCCSASAYSSLGGAESFGLVVAAQAEGTPDGVEDAVAAVATAATARAAGTHPALYFLQFGDHLRKVLRVGDDPCAVGVVRVLDLELDGGHDQSPLLIVELGGADPVTEVPVDGHPVADDPIGPIRHGAP
jgi:hypothetical protein